MAIVISQSQIYNYNFNILKNNYINRVKSNITTNYNYDPMIINLTGTSLGEWSVNSYSDTLWNATINRKSNMASSSISFDYQDGVKGYKIYDPIEITLQFAYDRFDFYDIKKLVNSIDIKMEYNDGSVEEESIQFSFQERLTQFIPILEPSGLGNFIFNSTIESSGTTYKKWYIYGSLLRRIDKDNGDTTSLVKYVENITITINPEMINESINYEYTNAEENYDNFELSNTSMFDKNVGFDDGSYIDIVTPIYEIVSRNIVEKYQNGKMTLEIETRYTTFKDSDGNEINNGKPYLIKVGDVVKPEMTKKFKNFQYEYIVTSAEYEYNGSDKLYLKLLQIN